MKKKIISFVLVVMAAMSLVSSAFAANFTDVKKGSWYYDSVQWAVSACITNGVSSTKFAPNDTLTRAQMLTFMYRAAGSPTVTKNMERNAMAVYSNSNAQYRKSWGAPEIKTSDYWYKPLVWATCKGVETGTSIVDNVRLFFPNDKVSRGETMIKLYLACGRPIYRQGTESMPFYDVSQLRYNDNWELYEACRYFYNRGIVTGMSTVKVNGKTQPVFGIANTLTRAQMVTFLYRMNNTTAPNTNSSVLSLMK